MPFSTSPTRRTRTRLIIKVITLISFVAFTELAPLWASNAGEPFASIPDLYLFRAQSVFRVVALGLLLDLALAIFSFFYRGRKRLSRGSNDSVLLGLRNLYYIVLGFLALAAIVSAYGGELTSVFTSLSIIAAAIAILSRDFIVEIISGLILSFSRQVSVGDYVSLGNTRGRITTLTLTKTVLLNEDDDLVHVPNSKLFGGELVNYTQRMQRRVSIEFEVALARITTIDDFEQRLTEALHDFTDVIEPKSPGLRVVELKKDSATFKFRYTLKGHDRQAERHIRRRTARAVIDYVRVVGEGKISEEELQLR